MSCAVSSVLWTRGNIYEPKLNPVCFLVSPLYLVTINEFLPKFKVRPILVSLNIDFFPSQTVTFCNLPVAYTLHKLYLRVSWIMRVAIRCLIQSFNRVYKRFRGRMRIKETGPVNYVKHSSMSTS